MPSPENKTHSDNFGLPEMHHLGGAKHRALLDKLHQIAHAHHGKLSLIQHGEISVGKGAWLGVTDTGLIISGHQIEDTKTVEVMIRSYDPHLRKYRHKPAVRIDVSAIETQDSHSPKKTNPAHIGINGVTVIDTKHYKFVAIASI